MGVFTTPQRDNGAFQQIYTAFLCCCRTPLPHAAVMAQQFARIGPVFLRDSAALHTIPRRGQAGTACAIEQLDPVG